MICWVANAPVAANTRLTNKALITNAIVSNVIANYVFLG